MDTCYDSGTQQACQKLRPRHVVFRDSSRCVRTYTHIQKKNHTFCFAFVYTYTYTCRVSVNASCYWFVYTYTYTHTYTHTYKKKSYFWSLFVYTYTYTNAKKNNNFVGDNHAIFALDGHNFMNQLFLALLHYLSVFCENACDACVPRTCIGEQSFALALRSP